MENVVSDSEWEKEKYAQQTCQPLVKENLEIHEKKSGDSTKNSEILVFTRSNPFSIAGTIYLPTFFNL